MFYRTHNSIPDVTIPHLDSTVLRSSAPPAQQQQLILTFDSLKTLPLQLPEHMQGSGFRQAGGDTKAEAAADVAAVAAGIVPAVADESLLSAFKHPPAAAQEAVDQQLCDGILSNAVHPDSNTQEGPAKHMNDQQQQQHSTVATAQPPNTVQHNGSTLAQPADCTQKHIHQASVQGQVDDEKVEPTCQHTAAHQHQAAAADSSATAVDKPAAPILDQQTVEAVADFLRRELGLTLFGFDVVVSSSSSGSTNGTSSSSNGSSSVEYVIIDVNYFPTFKGGSDTAAQLRAALKQAWQRHKQATAMCDES